MSQIVVSDVSQPVCLEKLRKALCDVMRLDQITNFVDTYILKIVLDVTASAQAAVFLLLCFQCEKSFPHERNERQGSHTRFGLCGVRGISNILRSQEISPLFRFTDGAPVEPCPAILESLERGNAPHFLSGNDRTTAGSANIGIVGTENQDRKRTGRQRLTPLPACSKKSIT